MMDRTTPGVSVVIPTYNRARRVARAVRSVLEQTRPAEEVIVVDDGSTDGTAGAIRREFADAVRLIERPNAGPSAARNTGVRAARHDLIAFLDSDDAWRPDKLERQRPVMDDPGVVLAATNWVGGGDRPPLGFADLSLEGEVVVLEAPLRHLSRFSGHRIVLPTWLVRRDALLAVGGFDERLRVGEDNRALFRLGFEGKIALVTAPLTVLSDERDAVQLTRADEVDHRRAAAAAMAEVFAEVYTRAADEPKDVQAALARLLAYYLRAQSELAAVDGRAWLARRRALETLALRPRGRDAAIALAALAAPGLLARRTRRKHAHNGARTP